MMGVAATSTMSCCAVLRARADPSAVNLLTADDEIEAKLRVALGNA